ncbi:flagellar basal body P-ring formation chaperone FlgA [Desulfurivibrio alkaliphilus]|uniref:Flagella basal body P-ring formation protein FlgA n=1 Tax=Desulfurivibrio alkaliphilus (strain DSM 19089 / UNIQEM U267 / AHT2) TaxID=589865 RepID=D6Z728_DESAT|nr:flagellar basal body P-ring formation chaperone FlgA [Desulfurivibrio alkaliphilus]ADH87015.1 flagella basal body P-ring formation protein FlgA [Desulfurivibrio alkaliphilus AHT 2]
MTTGPGLRLFIAPLLLLLLILAAIPVQARSGGSTITLGESDLQEIFAAIIAKESIWPRDELEISGFSAFPASVTIPAGLLDYQLDNALDPGHLGRQSLQVTLLVNGKAEARVRLNANLQRMGQVVMTARRINRGEVISRDDLVVHRRDIGMLDGSIINDPALVAGMQLRTTLQAGAIVYQNLLEKPPLVRRGDRVTIRASTGRVLVNAPGEVREIGAEGDLVRVRNLMSRREIMARVVNSGLVETEL